LQTGLFGLFDDRQEGGILIDEKTVDWCAFKQAQGGWGFPRTRPPHRSPFGVHFVKRIALGGA
jgi:hypothetical protein